LAQLASGERQTYTATRVVQRRFVVTNAHQRHVVQFYENDEFLREVLTVFSGSGLQADECVILIAAEANRRAVERRLGERGFDVAAATASGRLVLLDAREVLATIIVDGVPSSDLFEASFRRLLAPAAADGRGVRIYGEMVDLLWQDGNHAAAIRLEEMGNSLATAHPIRVLCGYAMDNFVKASDADEFDRVCALHTDALPTEGHGRALDAAVERREIARLQQRARSLETELSDRHELELALRRALDREQLAHEAKARFMASLGHQLRNPIGAIVLALDLLNAQLGDEGTRERGVLDREVKQLVHLLDELLDAARVMDAGAPIRTES
jgi:signal transduction histidine kinase